MAATFKRREVDRAFRTFNDRARDLMQSDHTTWDDSLRRLLDHCENDPVMKVVTEPLRTNPNVDPPAWYRETVDSVQGTVGSARYRLPIDDEDCAALIYNFLRLVETDSVDLTTFCVHVFGVTDFDDMARVLNRELVTKFVREVSYRLVDVTQDIGDATEVSPDSVRVFHHFHDHSTTIHGNVQGSVVAAGGGSVTGSSAAYTTAAGLGQALKALRPLVAEVAEGQRAAVSDALDKIIRAADGHEVSPEEAVGAAKTIQTDSPTLWERVRVIGWKVGGELGSLAIIQAIKSVAGVP